MKLLYLMTLPSQQFCLYDTLFNMHDTLIKHALRLTLGHSQCKTLSQSPRHLITYYLWYFADVAAYLLKKEVKKIRLQVLFRLQVHIVRGNK